MREHAVAAAWVNYGAFGLPLHEWVFSDMLAPLAEARVPVFLSPLDAREGQRVDMTDWSGGVRVCQAFPSLPVIATECRVSKAQRAMWAAWPSAPTSVSTSPSSGLAARWTTSLGSSAPSA